jgi:predicted AlkP superfamily phosphohydrolase/phosphomutase
VADPQRRLLLIGLDAADAELVERWTSDGTLPHLAELKRAGTWGRLSTSAKYLTGSPWPTFYTGRPPSDHGLYHDFQWRQESMEFAVPTTDWLPVRPFWRGLEDDLFVLVHDVPMTPGTEPFHGVEVTGWGSHDKLVPPCTHPPYLLEQIRKRYGDSPIQTDVYGRQSLGSLRRLHRQLQELTQRSAELSAWLLRLPWHLAIVAFGALHRGGHRFWDRSSVEGPIPENLTAWYDGALRELYVAADRAVGDLVTAAPEASVFVFSLHGMMVNSARVDLLDGMLGRLLRGPETVPPRPSRLRRFGEAIPLPLRHALTHRVPERLKNRLMTQWTTGGVEWEKTRAFTLRADLHGYVRINLKGREARGIVPPDQLDALCDQIRQGLLSFGDAMSGENIIEEIRRAPDVFPPGTSMDRLPDLIVRWKETSGAPHLAVESARFGRVPRATPGRIPNGRSGNHRPVGFLMARGPGIPAGGRLQPDADILDLAPTVVRRLGARSSAPLAGKVLQQLV